MKIVALSLILLISLISLFFAPNSYAGSQSGKVIGFYVRASDNLHWFTLSNNHNSSSACATAPQWAIKDENSTAGKTQISILLAAWASGKTIIVSGSNSCSRWGDIEDVNIIPIGLNNLSF